MTMLAPGIDTSMTWNGPQLDAALRGLLATGLNQGGEYLRSRSVPRAPVDTGLMRSTAHVIPATGTDLEAWVVYDTPYTVRQHEDLGLNHPNGGEAKFLERPLVQDSETIVAIIGAPLRRFLG